jgi:leader peptidase (prepilin peptidase)/N-methyltransferase
MQTEPAEPAGTAHTTVSTLSAAAMAAAGALIVSPVLAAWSAALASGHGNWWLPRRVSGPRWLAVAAVAAGFTALTAGASPRVGWLLLAAGGSVLAVVDLQTYRLPTPLVAALGVAELATLSVTAILGHDPARLVHSLLAAAAVTAAWFTLAFVSPSSLGLGDVWLAGLTAGLLGWSGWSQVLLGQAAAWLLALPLAGGVALAKPGARGRQMPVPLGPALIAGALAACWL